MESLIPAPNIKISQQRYTGCHRGVRQSLARGMAPIPDHEPVSTAEGSLMVTERIRIGGLYIGCMSGLKWASRMLEGTCKELGGLRAGVHTRQSVKPKEIMVLFPVFEKPSH